ncbi:MAG: hypothetical protein LBM13_03340 [Candidatus Ancillula sp.]|nr:hypothetical protein [Candidatus Ancillula sp.]
MTVQDSLINMLIDEVVNKFGISYQEAFDRVYSSDVVGKISDPNTTYSTWATDDLLNLVPKSC